MSKRWNSYNTDGVASECYKCDMRVKYGECHEFCPSYKKFKSIRQEQNELIKKQRMKENFGYKDPFRYPRRTEIERIDKRWKNK